MRNRGQYYLQGQLACKEGRAHSWDNPYPEGSKQALQWFDGFMDVEYSQRVHLKFSSKKAVENGEDTPGLITLDHYVGIANFDGNLVKVFDLKIQERPPKNIYYRKRVATRKLITTVRFWDVGGGSQGSGTVETKSPPFLSAIEAMKVAAVKADITACEGINNEDELFKKLFPAVGDLIRVPDRIYNFQVFRLV